MKIEFDIDIEKFRWSLVGDGYLYDEVKDMPTAKLISILQKRITDYINVESRKSANIIADVLAMRNRKENANGTSKSRRNV